MQKQIKKFCQETGMTMFHVEHSLKLAIEHAFCEYLNILECEIDDLDNRLIKAVFRIPEEISRTEAKIFNNLVCEDDIITVEFDFDALPQDVQRNTYKYFIKYTDEIRLNETYKRWKKLVRTAVEGVIIKKHDDRVDIMLFDTDTIGVMEKRYYVPKEIPLYLKGRTFLFYVHKILKNNYNVSVNLSRNSINFPKAILARIVPWVKVKGIKRIAGKKAWLAMPSVEMDVINELRRELKGEIIEIIPFQNKSL